MEIPDIKVLIVDNYDSFTYNIAPIIRNFSDSNLQIIEAGWIDLKDIDDVQFHPESIMTSSGAKMIFDFSGIFALFSKYGCQGSVFKL